jgi:uncharacterized coiled-coil protein SlyX
MSDSEKETKIETISLAVTLIRQEVDKLHSEFAVLRNRMNNVLMQFEEFEKQKKETRKAKRGKK